MAKPSTTIITLVSFIVGAGEAAAQDRVPRFSQHGNVSQTITGVTIEVDYDRPTARGRELFGGVVHWGEFWTPGANWATTIESDGDFRVNGHSLEAGKYSVWMIPQPEEWTVVISADDSVFHTQRPASDLEVARFTVEPQEADNYLDALSFYFPSVGPHYATLMFQWGSTAVALELEVDSYPQITLSSAERAVYVGEYRVDDGRTVTVEDEDGVLNANGLSRSGNFIMHLVPRGEHRFDVGRYLNGELMTVYWTDRSVVFRVEGDRAIGWSFVRDGDVQYSATRR